MSEELPDNLLIRKNANDFSFTKEIINEINNDDFRSGVKEFYQMLQSDDISANTSKTYIWTALSAITDDVGETLYQNVLNYLQNVADIDTCTPKALQSMIQILGAKYTVADGIDEIPLELADQLEVFSMRRECLLDSNFVKKELVGKLMSLSAYQSPAQSEAYKNGILSGISNFNMLNADRQAFAANSNDDELPYKDDVSVGLQWKIDSKVLDDFISSTYYKTILNNVTLTYGKLEDDKPIYEVLSSNIILSGFIIPNKYKDYIDKYKTKWNIPHDFEPEDEMKKIEAGLSTYDNYTLREQALLDVERKREAEALVQLEPTTRYAYLKEAKVKEYFKFVEDWYNEIVESYRYAKEYDVDNTYIDVTSPESSGSECLLTEDGLLNYRMIQLVVEKLLDITHKLQDIREYLKSHAQRTYMKGTYLLLSYLINEHLKQNIYPTMQKIQAESYLSVDKSLANSDGSYNLSDLHEVSVQPISWNQNDCVLTMNEYVDQSQYFNIETDIPEDKLQRQDVATDLLSTGSLNGRYWQSGSTTNGNASYIDTTNIFRAEDKSKLILSKTFSIEQIADFYANVLGASKGKDYTNGQKQTYVNNFLATVFESGADDTWWDEQHKKIMATLRDGSYTVDIDRYIDKLSAAYLSSYPVLDEFDPIENTTVRSQLDLAYAQYKERIAVKFRDYADELAQYMQQYIDQIDEIIAQLEEKYQSFDSMKTRANSMFAVYSTYTPDFNPTSEYIINNIEQYSDYVRDTDNDMNGAVRNSIINQIDDLVGLYNVLQLDLANFCQSTSVLTAVSQAKQFYIDLFTLEISPDIEDVVRISQSLISEKVPSSSDHKYERAYDAVISWMTAQKSIVFAAIQKLKDEIQKKIDEYTQDTSFMPFVELSALLSDYYLHTFSLIGCPDTISGILDYSNDGWYKYKQQLFKKYTGLELGQTPYYYLENTVHPSYQIHPCLSNFIEKVDFSYPIQNLGGIVDSVLKQEEENLINTKIASWKDSNGYLVDAWKNPLNSNTDYITRYEQADHKDSNLSDNPYFGWDGFFHPKLMKKVAEQSNYIVYKTNFSTIAAGQNLTENEKNDLLTQYREVSSIIAPSVINSYDIKQYGLDSYGNSYILLSSATATNPYNGTLWFRRKNWPIPSLAFVLKKNVKADGSIELQFSNGGAFSYTNLANTKFKSATKTIAIGNAGYFTPIVDDFTFSRDGTTLLLNLVLNDYNDIATLHGIVQQDFVSTNEYKGNKMYFLQDKVSRKESLVLADGTSIPSNWKFASWFQQDSTVGAVYLDSRNSISTNVLVSKYYKYDNSYHNNISTTLYTPTRSQESNTQVVADCAVNGSIAVAYDVAGKTFLKTDMSANYIGQISVDGQLLSNYMKVGVDPGVKVHKLQVYGDSIFEDTTKTYKPMLPAGFIVAGLSTDISRTGYNNDEDENNERRQNGVLKFQLAIPSAQLCAGIDFRFVCPVRMTENYMSAVGEDSDSYHFYREYTTSLCGVLTGHQNVHFFESVYNQYVAAENDEQYYELVDQERLGRTHPDKIGQAGRFDYLQLAHYDVAKYLSALKSEDRTDISTQQTQNYIPNYIMRSGFTQPYMMTEDSIPSTYIKGYYVAGYNSEPYPFVLNRSDAIKSATKAVIKLAKDEELSVSWINHNGKIKLDFNAKYYFADGLNSLSVDQLSALNERNRLNMFLNLDRPGEAGVLNIWKRITSGTKSMIYKQSTWMIKNISDTVPKFIMAKADVPVSETASEVAGIEASNSILFAAGASGGSSNYTTLLATEGIDTQIIAFE